MKHLKPILVTIIILLLTLTVFLTKDSVRARLSTGQANKGLVGHWPLDLNTKKSAMRGLFAPPPE